MEVGESPGEQEHQSSDSSWYLLAAAFLRSHGLPYKGENLPDMPLFHAEVLYQTYLAVEQLPHPGYIWDDPLESVLNLAAIREARRRVTLRGKLYEGVDKLTSFDLGRLRPESAEVAPQAARVQQLIRERITQTNYNVQYDFPALSGLRLQHRCPASLRRPHSGRPGHRPFPDGHRSAAAHRHRAVRGVAAPATLRAFLIAHRGKCAAAVEPRSKINETSTSLTWNDLTKLRSKRALDSAGELS